MNTHDTQVMYITNLHLVYHTTHVVYRYTRDVYIDNKMHWFCIWAASTSILPLTKYMGLPLLTNMWKFTYIVETRIKLNSYVATCSMNHIIYVLHMLNSSRSWFEAEVLHINVYNYLKSLLNGVWSYMSMLGYPHVKSE